MTITPREIKMFWMLSVFILLTMIYAYAVKPTADRIDVLERVLPEKNAELKDIKNKSQQYLMLQSALEGFKKEANAQGKNFELLAFLELMVNSEGLTDNVSIMQQKTKPFDSDYTEIIVELGLDEITLEDMVNFLKKLESSENFTLIKSLYTHKSSANSDLLDTVLQISTIR